VERPQRVGPALLNEAAIGLAHLRPEQGVVDPALRRVDIEDKIPKTRYSPSGKPSRFQTKPMKAAMLLNDGSGNRDF
jgi:hypothetical protein